MRPLKAPVTTVIAALALVVLSPCCRSRSAADRNGAGAPASPVQKAGIETAPPVPAPVPSPPAFSPNATVTLSDGTALDVADFSFYSETRGFGGGFYTPVSGLEDWPLTVIDRHVWKRLSFERVQTVELSERNDWDWLTGRISLVDGTRVAGTLPRVGGVTWLGHGTFYLLGQSQALGRTGQFRCELPNVVRIERLGQGGGPITVRVSYKEQPDSPQLTADVTDPRLELSWDNDTPNDMDVYAIDNDMPVKVRNTEVQVKPKEIDSIVPAPGQAGKFDIKLKNGEAVRTELPARVYGKLQNGDILFMALSEDDRPTFKTIVIK